MSEIGAYLIKAIKEAMTTDDGEHMLLAVEQPDGNEVALAFPKDQLLGLVDLAALTSTQADQIAKQPPNRKAAFNASWFELGVEPQTQGVILSLTFGAGGVLSFRMERAMAEKILETLRVHVGGETPQTPETPRH